MIDATLSNDKIYVSQPLLQVVKFTHSKSNIKPTFNNDKSHPTKCIDSISSIQGYIYGILYTICDCISYIFIKMEPSFNGFNNGAIRYLLQIIVMIILLYKNGLEICNPEYPYKILFLRGFTGSVALVLGFLSLQYLDISDTQALINSCVIITALMGKIFLKEKITIMHIASLFLTISGVMFILRPSILFGVEEDLERVFHMNVTAHNQNSTLHHPHQNTLPAVPESSEKLIGVTLVLSNAFCLSISQVSTRSLANSNVHHSLIGLYPSFIGMPLSILGSFFIYVSRPNSSLNDFMLPWDYFYSLNAGLWGVVGLIFLNNALKHEDAAKIGMLRVSGVLFSMVFQYLILDVQVDFLGVIGAALIITGTLMIIFIKIYSQRIIGSKSCYRFLALEF